MTNGPITNIIFAETGQTLMSITRSLVDELTCRLTQLLPYEAAGGPTSSDKQNHAHRNADSGGPYRKSCAQCSGG